MSRLAAMLRTARVLSCMTTALLLLLPPGAATAQTPTVQTLYKDALAKEQAVRTALADPQEVLSALKAVRTVVADFEAIVRRYPTSAYSDDALWHGGQLSLDAFIPGLGSLAADQEGYLLLAGPGLSVALASKVRMELALLYGKASFGTAKVNGQPLVNSERRGSTFHARAGLSLRTRRS